LESSLQRFRKRFVSFALFWIVALFVPVQECFGEQIAIMGAGYVGLVTSALFAHWGHEVVCIDIDQRKIDDLQRGILPLAEPGLDAFLTKSKSSVIYTHDIKEASTCQIIYICLGTPTDPQGQCDCSSIDETIDQIMALEPGPKTICIKSTVPPGTMRRLKQHLIKGKREDIELIYNPEFMRQGSALEDILHKNPIVLGGEAPMSVAKIEALYRPLLLSNPQIALIKTNYETAELIKYGWNGFSALRIAYINELSRLCRDLSADVFTLIQGISMSEELLPTKEIKPGCGFGGSCLPKDTLVFSKILENYGLRSSLIHQAITSNQNHINDLLDSIQKGLGPSIKGKEVAILGVSFKANTDDVRNSPAITVIEKLKKEGASIRVYDSLAMKKMKEMFPEIAYFDSPYLALENADCVVVLTDSDEIKELQLDCVAAKMKQKILIDPRNVFEPRKARSQGFKLINLGRI
jgi:UDPglucose 6-dehydrogenase